MVPESAHSDFHNATSHSGAILLFVSFYLSRYCFFIVTD